MILLIESHFIYLMIWFGLLLLSLGIRKGIGLLLSFGCGVLGILFGLTWAGTGVVFDLYLGGTMIAVSVGLLLAKLVSVL